MNALRKSAASLAVIASLALPLAAGAQSWMMGNRGMMGNVNAANVNAADQAQTAKDEADGKAIWDKLQSKQATCASLTDDDFDLLGDYFMGLMSGSAHAAMNANMTRMMGEAGEKAMHVALGKRLSGCQPDAQFPAQDARYGQFYGGYPMMGMMGAGWYGGDPRFAAYGTSRADAWPFWVFATVTMLLVWILLVLAIIALVKWILKQK